MAQIWHRNKTEPKLTNCVSVAEFTRKYAPEGMSERVVWGRCRAGLLPGAFQVGRRWYINVDVWLRATEGRE